MVQARSSEASCCSSDPFLAFKRNKNGLPGWNLHIAAAEYMNCTGITTSVLGRELMTTCRRSKQSVVLIPRNCTTIILHSLSIYIQRGSCTCIYLVKCKTEASSFNNNITGDICSKCPAKSPRQQACVVRVFFFFYIDVAWTQRLNCDF